VEVDVFSEETLTGRRRPTSHAFLTFVGVDREGGRVQLPPLIIETDEERRVCEEAKARRAERLKKKAVSLKSEV
jgi:acyl-CoA hydrolase